MLGDEGEVSLVVLPECKFAEDERFLLMKFERSDEGDAVPAGREELDEGEDCNVVEVTFTTGVPPPLLLDGLLLGLLLLLLFLDGVLLLLNERERLKSGIGV